MSNGRSKAPIDRMEELIAEIRRHDELYYNQGRPELADSQYDELVAELRALEAEHGTLAGSPTQEVGRAPAKRFPQVEHRVPMLSLDSLTSPEEVIEFDERVRKALERGEAPLRYSLEPKYDGVSASLLYEEGKLVRGLTRGDGRVGEEITENLLRVRNLPERMKGGTKTVPRLVEVRGEVILSKSRFLELRELQEERGEAPFRNARNAVAGSLKRVNPSDLDMGMEFFFWGVGDLVGLDDVRSYSELAGRFREHGFTISPDRDIGEGIEAAIAYHDRLEDCRDELAYEMDGIVAKVDDLAAQRLLGRTARAPRWSMAHKFAPRAAETRVRDIRVQVGRTGALTPVADLEPVELAGVTVQRATLHNFELLADKDVRIGDRVRVERAGDVIPEVTGVHIEDRVPGSRPVQAPTLCPACAEPVEQEGAYYYCTNIECPAQIRRRIVHLAGRRALDLDRLGPKYVDQLFQAGLIQCVEDVFTLPEHEEEILALERWGPQSFANLVEEVERAKKPPLPRFLHALGIRHVGEKVAADLAEAFGSLDAIRRATPDALLEVEGIGPRVAAEVESFFRLPSNRRFLAAVERAGVVVQGMAPGGSQLPLAGRIFVFTGGLETMTRDQARERVESLGAATSSGISKRVTDVVVGTGAGSKREKAEKLGLAIRTEEEFLDLLNEAG
ncbi:MAG: NAD-dependent DNA ligase LigA [Planctomycetota bacterium]